MKTFNQIFNSIKSTLLVTILLFTCTEIIAGWSQVTSVAVGDQIVITEIDDGTKELSSITTYGVGTTYTNTPAGTMIWTVVAGNSDGTFAFKNGNQYLRWNSGNSVDADGTSVTANTSWTISTSNSRVKVANVNDNSRILMWNKSGTRFACYSGKNHGNNSGSYYYYVMLYKKSADCTSTLDAPIVTAKGGNQKATLSWEAVTDATKYQVSWNGGDYVDATSPYVKNDLTNGTQYAWKVMAIGNGSSICDSEEATGNVTPSITYINYTTVCTAPSKTTISYNKNTTADVTGTLPASVEQNNGEAYTVSTSTLSRTGYNFVGWNTDKNATSAISSISGDDITGTPITLYAIWSANSYDVIFNGNGATSGEMSAQSIKFDASANLTANAFARTGYTFSGWAESAQGEKKYNDQVSYTMTTEGANLYAVWTPQVYDITYKDQGDADFSGTHGANCPTKHTYGTATNLVSPTKTHYTFSGWFGNSECSGDALTSIPAEAYTANFTLYAKWKADQKYAATFYVNGQVYGTAVEYFEGQSVKFPATNPSAPLSCSDKVFTGWTNEDNKDYKSETTAPDYVTSATMGTAAVNFYAVFANASGESNVYVKGALSDLQTGKKVLILSGSTAGDALSSEAATTNGYLKIEKVTITNDAISTTNSNIIWNVTLNNSKYKFDQGASKILNLNTSNNLFANSTSDEWSINLYTGSTSYQMKSTINASGTYPYFDRYGDSGFKSWSSSTSNKVDFYIQSVAYTNFATKCKECENSITITKGTESNGTFELSKTGVVCLDDVQGGYSVTVTANPAEHYHFASVTTSSGNAGTISDNQCVVSGITASTTITAVFEENEKVNITWHVNGVPSTTTNVEEGTAFADVTGKPSVADDATDCGDKFMGWATALITKEEATASDVSWATETTISSTNKDFYAVWATKDGSESSYTIPFTNSATQNTTITTSTSSELFVSESGRSYLTATPASNITKAYYGDNQTSIRVGKNGEAGTITLALSNAGQVNATKISVNTYLYSSTKTATLSVNGATAQDIPTTAGDLTFDFDGSKLTSVTLSTSQYAFINSVKVTYGGTTASNYITTCAAAVNHTLTVEVSPALKGTITNPATSSVELAENKGTQALAVTAAEGYGFKTWQFNGEASGATLTNPTSTTGASVKMGTADITLTAVFAPLRTVTLSNGQDSETTQVHGQYIAGTVINVPANTFKVTGKKFSGWKVGDQTITDATYTMPDKDVKFVAQWVDGPATMWELVTDASTLQAGDLLIMANKGRKVVAGGLTGNSSSYFDKVTATENFDEDILLTCPDAAQKFTLGGSAGQWKLFDESGYVLEVYGTTNMDWEIDAVQGGDVTFTISIADDNATIASNTSSYGRFIYNVNATRFSTYTNNLGTSYELPQLYRYTGTTYQLTYDANGGENAPSKQTTSVDSYDITITSVEPDKEGYDFLCWNTKENGSGTNYSAGDVITLSDNTTLYAKWLLHQEYSVVYDINGGTGTIPVDENTYEAGEDVTLKPATGFSKMGYNFVGWMDKNGYYYTAGSDDEFEMPVGGATLKALWYSAYSFTRVTDVSKLHEGDKIIIVDRTSELVAGDVYDDTYLEQISLSGISSNNTTNKVPYEGNVFTLEKDNDGYWNLINWQGSKLSAGSGKLTYDGDYDYWQISIASSGAATLTVKNGSTVYTMWSNYNSDRFACYTSSQSAMHVPQIYRLDNYTREAGKFSNGKISTVCLPYAVNEPEDIVGCTVYEITGKELQGGDPYKVFFDQVFSMEAGKPYVVELDENATEAKFFYSGTAVANPNNDNTNGLIGTFTAIDDKGAASPVLEGNYMIYSNQIKKCGEGCLVGANKAYIVMDDVPLESGASAAPGRRLTLGVEQAQTPTNLSNNLGETDLGEPQKVIINNQMFIIRGGKMYNASGALVK